MNHFPEQVAHFNKVILKVEQPNTLRMDVRQLNEGYRCLNEESNEFILAVNEGNIVKTVDALIDLQYFALGIMYKMGLTVEQIERCMTAVHQANMFKQRGTVVRQGVEHHTDAIKPDGWEPPEDRIKEILGL